MKTIEQTRRELFECRFNLRNLNKERDEDGDISYLDDWVQGAWVGFNTTLDAVVIELPALVGETALESMGGSLWDSGHDSGICKCRTAIESTGLGLKVK